MKKILSLAIAVTALLMLCVALVTSDAILTFVLCVASAMLLSLLLGIKMFGVEMWKTGTEVAPLLAWAAIFIVLFFSEYRLARLVQAHRSKEAEIPRVEVTQPRFFV